MIANAKIIYCGMDLPTFFVVFRSSFLQLVAVNYLPELDTFSSFNPIDNLFRFFYRQLHNKKPHFTIFLLLNVSYLLGSKITRTFFNYVKIIYQHNLAIVDVLESDKAIDFIINNKIDLMIVNNWWLLPQEIIDAPRSGTLNIHPSKLPQYRGSVPILWSLKNNDQDTAVTFMLLDRKMDGGEILAQYPFDISPDDDAIVLENKCNDIVAAYLDRDIKKFLSGELKPIHQDDRFACKTAKYFDYQQINWKTELGKDIVNKIKLYPYSWPFDQCFTYFKEQPLYFNNAQITAKAPTKLTNAPPGTGMIKGSHLYIHAINHFIKLKLFVDLSFKQSLYLLRFRKQMLWFDEAAK